MSPAMEKRSRPPPRPPDRADARQTRDTNPHHQQRGDDESGKRQPRDGLIRTPDQTHQPTTHSREEKAGDGHDDRCQQRPEQAAGEVIVDQGHGNDQHEGGYHDIAKIEVQLQSGRAVTRRSHGRSMGPQSPSNRLGQRPPQPPEGVEGAYQHGADRDGADIVVPDGIGQIGPLGLDTSRPTAEPVWIEKKGQGDEHEPGQQPAREVDRGQLGR